MKQQFQSMKDQFNGNTKKRHPPLHLTGREVYEMVKDVHVVLAKRKRTGKNTEEDDTWKKQSIFLELPCWKDLDVLHSIDVMHVKKNVCESLLGTLLNIDGKTRDHGRARANVKKMGIRPELWPDDSVKGTELPTSCITLSRHEELCGFLKNVKVPSGYSMNVSRLISFPDLEVAPDVRSHDYHVLLTQMTVVGIRNILPVNVREAIMNFCFFFNAIGKKVLSEEALESLKKGTMKVYASYRCIFLLRFSTSASISQLILCFIFDSLVSDPKQRRSHGDILRATAVTGTW
jgi:hypothetical protein